MFEDRFADLLEQYPDAVLDKKKFSGLLRDFFPGQERQINLIATAYDLGIAAELDKASEISNALAFRFVKRLVNEYGISRMNADWAISLWCVCYGEKLLHKPCEISISRAGTGAAPAIREERNPAGQQYNDLFSYIQASDGYAVAGFKGGAVQTLIVPNGYKGKPVNCIQNSAFEDSSIQEAVVLDGIREIGENAFKGCKELKQTILPGTLKRIGRGAFEECRSLNSAALPHGLEQIGDFAFTGTALKHLALPAMLTQLGEGSFKNCGNLSSIIFSHHLSVIPDEAFRNCRMLRTIELPESVVEIGRGVFSGCSSLKEVLIPKSIVKIGEDAFSGTAPSFTLLCIRNSEAERYARIHNFAFRIVL